LSDDELGALAEEQAALRRVAMLVAQGAPLDEVIAAVTDEVSRLLSVVDVGLCRYESDGSVEHAIASGRERAETLLGKWRKPEGSSVSALVFDTGQPARIDRFAHSSGPLRPLAPEPEVGSAVGTPIIVEGQLWGVLGVYGRLNQVLPENSEERIAVFAELLGTAIANAGSRAELAQLAKEQAALRRVATLVARGVPAEEVFTAVADEVANVFGAQFAHLGRYEADESVSFVAVSGGAGALPVGARMKLGGDNVTTTVASTARPARIDNYPDASGAIAAAAEERGVRLSVGTPIIVEGRVWGVMVIGSAREQSLPSDTEARLVKFTDLLATAIANTDSRTALTRLLDEQAALRRVATLVARGTPPEEVFAAVIEQIGRLFSADMANLCRYEPDNTVTFVATWGKGNRRFKVGSRWPLGGQNLGTLILETGRPVRVDSYAAASGPLSITARDTGLGSAVASPIIVEGRLWGMIGAGSSSEKPLPPDTEERMASFTELVAMAIANSESRSELKASRARIIAATDETRRRIERDLHDGAQQQLVSLMLELRAAEDVQRSDAGDLEPHFVRMGRGLDDVMHEVREISQGIHPAILSKAGLGPALKMLARRSVVPVELILRGERRMPDQVEVAAYYVASEALANSAKHSQASVVLIELEAQDTVLRLTIGDDGVGGADPSQGSGLVGLADRIEALGGRLNITSPASKGTRLSVEIPVETEISTELP
jgi:signal transduction histidine kinase